MYNELVAKPRNEARIQKEEALAKKRLAREEARELKRQDERIKVIINETKKQVKLLREELGFCGKPSFEHGREALARAMKILSQK